MILKYGGYTHEQGECEIIINKNAIEDDNGFQIGYSVAWDVKGRILADESLVTLADKQADITSKLAALEAAYSQNGYNALIYLPDGVTLSNHVIYAKQAIAGTRIKSFGYPEGTGAQYVNYRDYSLQIFAEIVNDDGGGGAQPTTYTESFSITGTGGPKFVTLEMRNGPPIQQVVTQMTMVKASQTGSITSRFGYGTPSSPWWPNHQKLEANSVTRTVTGTYPNATYKINWSYAFESIGPLSFNGTN